ncbi:MAG: nicotinate-nucleotide adenylyltransferase [Chloroflexota bacterium]
MAVTAIGVLGGTFDPVHNGHLCIADQVKAGLELERVLFVPAASPWFKEDRDIAPAEHRLQMVNLAVAARRDFGVSTVDVDRGGATYTEDTLRDLRRQLGSDVRLYFIMGEDALMDFPMWRNPEHILQLCKLVAVKRPGTASLDMNKLERSIPGVSQRVIRMNNRLVDISSTEIRRRVASGSSISGLVPVEVERYIRQHGLYEPPRSGRR